MASSRPGTGVEDGNGVEQEESFDFEQEGALASGSDSQDTDGWGSEFDGNEDVDEYDVEADATGQMNRYPYWFDWCCIF